jgi:hypothetical protein
MLHANVALDQLRDGFGVSGRGLRQPMAGSANVRCNEPEPNFVTPSRDRTPRQICASVLRTRILSEAQTAARAAMESSPFPAVHGVVRRRIVDLCQWAHLEFGVRLSRP